MDLEGKAAIVTGGASGVGRATVLDLARRGCAVLVNYSRSRDEAEQTAAEASALGVRVVVHQADVAVDEQCRAMVAAGVRAFGRLDVLVNSAGTTSFIPFGSLEKVTDDDWSRILAVNLKGPFQCTRAAREPMLAAGGGAVVNVASIAGIRATGSSIPYAASKAALINMTIALARVLAPQIRVNAVAPGFIEGRWLKGGLGPRYDLVKRKQEERLPLGRVSQPEDVAAAILSLITGSRQVTGQTLVVDGGMLISDPGM